MAEDAPLNLLSEGVLAELAALGVSPDPLNRYGDERVRWALEALDAERSRRGVIDPTRWLARVLADHWGELPDLMQLGLPFGAAHARTHAPPDDARWGHHGPSGRTFRIARRDPDVIVWEDGSRLPSFLWSADWSWHAEPPDTPAPPPAGPDHGRFHLLAARFKLHPPSPETLEAQLASRGISRAEWDHFWATAGGSD